MTNDEQGVVVFPTPDATATDAMATTDAPAETPAADLAEAPDMVSQLGHPPATRDELAVVVGSPAAAREISASHLGRLLYSSRENWSRYVFHENDPQAAPRPPRARR